MKGYVINKSSSWSHVMKRSVQPGKRIPLDELYLQYGKKYHLKEGIEFVNWIREVKLRNDSRWGIVFEEEVVNAEEVVISEPVGKKPLEGNFDIPTARPALSKKDIGVEEIVGWSVRKAREKVNDVKDYKTLTYALKEAGQRPQKEVLCRILKKRIQELDLR